jgi:4,5-dihydroxyphthalate decarboxylase
MLSDDHGVQPGDSHWVIGGLDRPMAPFDFVPQLHPADVDVRPAPAGKALGPMLVAGEIDALFSANVPQCVLAGSPQVSRLFPDYRSVERDYYRRTGVFPMMHTIVLPTEQAGLARAVYDGFLAARNVAMQRYDDDRRLYQVGTMVPWLNDLFEDNRCLFPTDWWPYGVAGNRTTIDTFLRYHYEQGLSQRRLTPEDLFPQALLSA